MKNKNELFATLAHITYSIRDMHYELVNASPGINLLKTLPAINQLIDKFNVQDIVHTITVHI